MQAKTKKAVSIAILLNIVQFYATTSRAQASQASLSAQQQTFVTTLAKYQAQIDSLNADVRTNLLNARQQVDAIAARAGQLNYADSKQLGTELLNLSSELLLAAGNHGSASSEKVSETLSLTRAILETIVAIKDKLKDDAASAQSLASANASLSAVQKVGTQLNQLVSERNRITAEAQKIGLLPNINYNARTGALSATSPARPVMTVAASPSTTAASQAVSSQFAIPTTPDPLALALLYEALVVYDDPTQLERRSTKAASFAFAKCMIEHRTMNAMRPNELWEFLTHSAYILKAKNAAGAMWPIALRNRTFPSRAGFEFHLTTKTMSTDFRTKPVNALAPTSLYALGWTTAMTTVQVTEMGFSDPKVCIQAPPHVRQPAQPSNDDSIDF